MTEVEKLNTVKALYGEDETDEVLSTYLNLAGDKIINRAYPYDDTVTEVPDKYAMLQCELAVCTLNKRGAEGQSAHTENGVSRQYQSDTALLRQVTPYVGVISK